MPELAVTGADAVTAQPQGRNGMNKSTKFAMGAIVALTTGAALVPAAEAPLARMLPDTGRRRRRRRTQGYRNGEYDGEYTCRVPKSGAGRVQGD